MTLRFSAFSIQYLAMRVVLICAVLLVLAVAAFIPAGSSLQNSFVHPRATTHTGDYADESPDLQKILALYADGNYFALRDLLKEVADRNDPGVLFAEAVAHHAFNQPAASNAVIDRLLSVRPTLPDSIMGDLRLLKQQNHLRLYEYGEALHTMEVILQAPASEIDSTDWADTRNVLPLFKALAEAPPQQTEILGETMLQMERDKANLRRISVQIDGATRQYVLDTGAELSVVTRSQAETLNLRIRKAGFEVTSSTGGTVLADVAVADEVMIGNVRYRNVVFMIFDDDALTWPQIDYSIPGVIGFPLIEAAGEVHFRQGDLLHIPASPQSFDASNLALEGLGPRVLARIQSGNGVLDADSVVCAFDSGARSTSLLAPFYRRHREEIETVGQPKEIEAGGAGGIVRQQGYNVPSMTLTIGGKTASLDSVEVHTTTTFEGPESRIGCNIGQDVIGQFHETILNFRSMSLLLR